FFAGAEKALAIVAVTWLVLRGLDVLMARFERRLDEHRHLRAMATVPLGRRSLKVFVAVVAFIAALQNFGFNVTGLIAGLGVGGLAVAPAAQQTVENLFGSVSLVAGATGARSAAGDDRLTSQAARRVGARALRPHGAAGARDRAARIRAHDALGRVRRDPGTDLPRRPGGGGRRRGAQVIRGPRPQ